MIKINTRIKSKYLPSVIIVPTDDGYYKPVNNIEITSEL
jgi:hypothetical protein